MQWLGSLSVWCLTRGASRLGYLVIYPDPDLMYIPILISSHMDTNINILEKNPGPCIQITENYIYSQFWKLIHFKSTNVHKNNKTDTSFMNFVWPKVQYTGNL